MRLGKISRSSQSFSNDLAKLISRLLAQTESIDLDIKSIIENIFIEIGHPIEITNTGSLVQAILAFILGHDADTAQLMWC